MDDLNVHMKDTVVIDEKDSTALKQYEIFANALESEWVSRESRHNYYTTLLTAIIGVLGFLLVNHNGNLSPKILGILIIGVGFTVTFISFIWFRIQKHTAFALAARLNNLLNLERKLGLFGYHFEEAQYDILHGFSVIKSAKLSSYLKEISCQYIGTKADYRDVVNNRFRAFFKKTRPCSFGLSPYGWIDNDHFLICFLFMAIGIAIMSLGCLILTSYSEVFLNSSSVTTFDAKLGVLFSTPK